MFTDFKKFLLRGNVVDLAVAVVIGAAFAKIIDAIVKGLITPLIGIPGGKSFAAQSFSINGSVFAYGAVVDAVIQFLIVAAAIFFIVVVPLNKMAARRKAGAPADEDTPAPSDETVLLAEIRDLLRQRQG